MANFLVFWKDVAWKTLEAKGKTRQEADVNLWENSPPSLSLSLSFSLRLEVNKGIVATMGAAGVRGSQKTSCLFATSRSGLP